MFIPNPGPGLFPHLGSRIQIRNTAEKGVGSCGPLPNYLTVSKGKGADPTPLPLRVGKAGRNHLNEEITLPPPNWDT
jgi:hypothetical protein